MVVLRLAIAYTSRVLFFMNNNTWDKTNKLQEISCIDEIIMHYLPTKISKQKDV